VVIPVEVRRTIKIEDRDDLEIFVDNNRIILMNINLHTSACFAVVLKMLVNLREEQFVISA
jgi:bifunctional DNA-binding transcriptional regulator/antitoxin component of YhaV-PrlF toxin-antitoxin module